MQSAVLISMESLSTNDLELLNWGICKIYTLSDVDTFGVDSLSIVHQLVPCYFPVFQTTNLRTNAVDMTLLPDDRYPPQIRQLVREVLPHHLHEHPIVQNLSITETGVYKISDFLSPEELHQREGLYQQFLKPLQIEEQMQFFLPVDPSGRWLSRVQSDPNQADLNQADMIQAGFILSHGSRSFTERDRLMLQLIRPHLSLAYRNVQRYQQLQQDLESLQQSISYLGLIIIDVEGSVKQTTAQAIAWLGTYFPTATELDRLPDRLWSWVGHQAARLNSPTDLAQPFLPLYIEQCNKRLAIRLVIEPDRNQYLLLLEEQTQSSLKSLELLGLSQRESEVIGLVIQGKDNRTIAEELGIGSSTVRKHLENTYRKFGVQSRTEAIAYALQHLGVLSS
jgi:DNA-binding CsgD family transcriptional regulator